jgi:transglutaminase-like putative cysteine protease
MAMSRQRHLGVVAGAATLLATAPLAAIYQGFGWLLPCVVAVAAVAAAAIVSRSLRAPLWAQAAAMVGTLTLAVTWLFRSGEEIAGILPGRATMEHFGALLGQLPADVREHAAPVLPLDSLMLVTVVGVGVVAILVDLCAAGARRPGLAGLPLLAIYSVPVAVSFDSVPMVLFVIGAAGYLWLLGADNVDRVRRFGRRFTGDGRDVDTWEPSPLSGAGRRLAVVGLLIAVAVPLAVPGMTTGLADRFGPSLGPGSGSGGSGTGRVNLFAELHGQLNLDETVELLRVHTDDPEPFYLRIATADQIRETGFEPSAASGSPVAQPDGSFLRRPGAPSRTGVTYHRHRAVLEISDDFVMQLAPTYAELTEINGLDDQWRYDPTQQIVFSPRQVARGLTYELVYRRAEYDPDALRQAVRLPPGHEIQTAFAGAPELPQVRELLDDLVDAADTPYDQVRDILDFFSRRNGFRYDLETGPETDAPAIVDFLDNRVGFCVQYATAMAWLVRSIDIPARVAFGFTRGTGTEDEDIRVLTNRNLHAWTEVYFSGFGWVPFDPTPSAQVAGSTSPDWAPSPDAPADPEATDPADAPTGDPIAPDGGGDSPDSLFPHEDGPVGGPGPTTGATWPWWGLGTALFVVSLLALPAVQRTALRRRRVPRRFEVPASPPAAGAVTSAVPEATARHRAHQVWDELIDTMIDLSIPVDTSETPRAVVRRLSTYTVDSPAADRALRRLGQIEERARYARQPVSPSGLRVDLSTLRHALAARATARVRTRAVLMPRSTLLRWRVTVSSAVTWASQAVTRAGDGWRKLTPRRLLRPAR